MKYKLSGRFPFVSKNINASPFVANAYGSKIIDVPISYIQNEVAYRSVSVVGSCIDQIASDFMQLPFKICSVKQVNGKIEKEDITYEERFNVFRKPNEWEPRS